MKIVTIIENNPVFGVKYGMLEISDVELGTLQRSQEQRAYTIQCYVRAKHINNCRTKSK